MGAPPGPRRGRSPTNRRLFRQLVQYIKNDEQKNRSQKLRSKLSHRAHFPKAQLVASPFLRINNLPLSSRAKARASLTDASGSSYNIAYEETEEGLAIKVNQLGFAKAYCEQHKIKAKMDTLEQAT